MERNKRPRRSSSTSLRFRSSSWAASADSLFVKLRDSSSQCSSCSSRAKTKPKLRRKTQRPDVNSPDDNDTSASSRDSKNKNSKVDSTKPEDKEPASDDRPTLKRSN